MTVQLGFDFIPPAGPVEKALRIDRTLPTDEAALIEAARIALELHDAAMVAGDAATAEEVADRVDAISMRLNGGTAFGMATEGGGQTRLAAALAAHDGTLPLWGQIGRFVLDVDGCWCVVEWEGPIFGICPFSITALLYDRPFYSSTGYHSYCGAAGLGCSVAEAVAATIRHVHARNDSGKPLKAPKPLEQLTGGCVYRGKERLPMPLPEPDWTDAAWQPGGWLHSAASERGWTPVRLNPTTE